MLFGIVPAGGADKRSLPSLITIFSLLFVFFKQDLK